MITRRAKHGCEFCNERQQSLIRLRVHKRMFHLSEGSLCPFCSSMFPDKLLSKHVNTCQKKLKECNDSLITSCKEDSALKLQPRLPKLPPEKIQVDWSSLLAHVANDCEPETDEDVAPIYDGFELPIKSISVEDGFHIIDLESSDEASDEVNDECEIRRRSLRSSGRITSFFRKTDETVEAENTFTEVPRKQRKRIRESISSGDETRTRKTRSAKQPVKRIRMSERRRSARVLLISDSDSNDPCDLEENVISLDEVANPSKMEDDSVKNLTIRLNRTPVTTQLPSSEDGAPDVTEEEGIQPVTRSVSDDDDWNETMSDVGPEPVYCAPAEPTSSDSSDSDAGGGRVRRHKKEALKKIKKVRQLLNSSSEEIVSDDDSDVLLSESESSSSESSDERSYVQECLDEDDELSLCSSDCSDAESEVSNADSRFLTLNCLSKSLSDQENRARRRTIPPFASLFVCFIIDPSNSEIAPPLPPPDGLPKVRMCDNEQLSVSCVCDFCGLITRKALQRHKLTVHATADFARCCYCLGLIPPPLYPLHTMILCNTRPGTYGTLLMMKQICNLCNPPLELRNPYLLLWHAIKEHSSAINENGNRFMCPECGGTFLDYFIECHSKLCKYAASINVPLSTLVGYSLSCKEAVEIVRKMVCEKEKVDRISQLKVKENAMINLRKTSIETKKALKSASKKKQRSPSENKVINNGASTVQKHVEKHNILRPVLKSNTQSNQPFSRKTISNQLEVIACPAQEASGTEPPTPVQRISPQKPKSDTNLLETLSDKLKAVSNEIRIDERGISKDFSTLFLYNIFDPLSPPSLSDAEPDDMDEDENGSGSSCEEDTEVSLNINSKPQQDEDASQQSNMEASKVRTDANSATDTNAVEDQVKNDQESKVVDVEQMVDNSCTIDLQAVNDYDGKEHNKLVEADSDVTVPAAALNGDVIVHVSEVETNLDGRMDVTSEEKNDTKAGARMELDHTKELLIEDNVVNGEKDCADVSSNEATVVRCHVNLHDSDVATDVNGVEQIRSPVSASGAPVVNSHSNPPDTAVATDVNCVEQIKSPGSASGAPVVNSHSNPPDTAVATDVNCVEEVTSVSASGAPVVNPHSNPPDTAVATDVNCVEQIKSPGSAIGAPVVNSHSNPPDTAVATDVNCMEQIKSPGSASGAPVVNPHSNPLDTAVATDVNCVEEVTSVSASGAPVINPHSNPLDTAVATDVNCTEDSEAKEKDTAINEEISDLKKGIDATATVHEHCSTMDQDKLLEPKSPPVIAQDAQISSKETKNGTQPSSEALSSHGDEAKSAKPDDDEDDLVIIDIERHVKPFSDHICEFCGKDTSKVNSLINHKRRNHKDGMRCPLCLSAIPKLLLYCHRRIFCPNLHGKVNWNLKCCICNCQQQTPFHLLRHAMVCHPKNITKSREEKADPNDPPRVRCEHCAAPVRPIFLDCHQEICLRKLRYEMKARPTKDTSTNEINDENESAKDTKVATTTKTPNERSHAEVKKVMSTSKFSVAGSDSAKSKETETVEAKSSHESEPEMNIDWLVEKMLVEQGNLQVSCAEGENVSSVTNGDISLTNEEETESVAEKAECLDMSDPQPPTLVSNIATENCFDDSVAHDSSALETHSDERALFLPSSTPLYQMDNSTVDAPYTEDDLPDVGCIESPIKLAEVPSPIRLPDTFRSPEKVGSSPYQSPVKRRVTRLSVKKAIDKERERKSAVNVPINNACEEMNMNIDLDESVLEPTASDEAMLEDISEVLEAVMREENGHGLE